LNINIYYDEINFRLKGWRKIKKLVEKVISNENKISDDLNFILTDDITLRKMNMKFLKHNYFTDVLSFNYGVGNKVNGEIYISVDTVKRNAINYKVSYNSEFVRVILHGVLHLCGYEDKYIEDSNEMKRMENFWLERYENI
jgi:probable rRNA maturation factor